jgi:hypothetical protein
MAETFEERLKKISESNTNTEEDEKVVLYLLRAMGLNSAVVTCGVVYPTGSGHPVSIQTAAKSILIAAHSKKKLSDVI